MLGQAVQPVSRGRGATGATYVTLVCVVVAQGYGGDLGQRDGFSAGDIKKLQSMYKCVGSKTMLED